MRWSLPTRIIVLATFRLHGSSARPFSQLATPADGGWPNLLREAEGTPFFWGQMALDSRKKRQGNFARLFFGAEVDADAVCAGTFVHPWGRTKRNVFAHGGRFHLRTFTPFSSRGSPL
jgi:hypothetical protein